MKFKRLTAAFIAVLMCMLVLTTGAGAAEVKKSIALNKTKATMYVGSSYTLKPTVTGYSKYSLQWSTSDKSVISVKAGGTVTANKAGTATVTVKVKGTKLKASCKFTVKKKTASSSKNTATSQSSSAYDPEKIVSSMTIGWNLGNTLDSTGSWLSNKMDCETAWGNPKTTKAMIDAVKKAGFNTIRIPVSWGDHIDADANIDKQWLDRVQEVVDYAYDNGMYVILNSHHDLSWIKLDAANEKNVTKKLKNLWKQIAARFKDYDEKLIFECLNEPRTEGSSKEWSGGTPAERKILNGYYDAIVKTIRATGGNNKLRCIMINPYAASNSYEAMNDLVLPDDEHLIVSVHSYSPYNMALNRYSDQKDFTDSGKKEIDGVLSNINKVFLSKGIPVIIGEFGTINKSNEAERAKAAEYFVTAAKKYGIPCVWWDNGSDAAPSDGEGFLLLNRKTLKWTYTQIVEALIKAAK